MLKINDLASGYGKKLVLDNLHLECEKGSIHGILGPNGAGKTTFFNTLFGFIKKRSGTILINGQPEMREQIAYLETEPYFYPLITGAEYLRIFKIKNPSFDENLWNRFFKLPLNDLIETYSTGMRKKLALTGILALEKPVLILDEPFNGVDLETVETIYLILEKLKAAGKTVLLTSHVMQTLTETCDEIHWLRNGHFFKSFSKKEFPQLEAEMRELIRRNLEERARG